MDNIFMEYFPHKTIRDSQQYILNEINNNIDKRYIILEAPTGIGKSAIAKTLSNYYKSSFIITLTKQLQDQYINQYNNDDQLVSIKGKANYKCDFNCALNCENAPCNYDLDQKKECLSQELCSYYKLRAKAFNAKSVITSYSYILRAFDCAGIWNNRELMVLDECHELENQIINWGKCILSVPELLKENILNNNEANDILNCIKNNYIDSAINIIFDIVSEDRSYILDKIKKIYDDNKDNKDSLNTSELSKLHSRYKIYDFYFRRIDVYLKTIDNYKNENVYYIKSNKKDEILITPLEIGMLFNYYLNKNINQKILFMSGTILDTTSFIRSLRIKKSDCLIIKMDSPFDYKKAPIINMNVASTNYANLEKSLSKLSKSVNDIIKNHNNEKGIIHTSNYKIAKYLYDNMDNKNRCIIRENNESNEALIYRHINSKDSIIISPSLTMGADLYDEHSRFQIIVKLPWQSLNDELIKKRMETSSRFYTLNMLKSFIQSCGRSIRNENDYCVTYVLDNSFEYYMKKFKKYLYPQFIKRLILNKAEWDINKYNAIK